MFRLPQQYLGALVAIALMIADCSYLLAQVTSSFTEPYRLSKVAASEIGVISKVHVVEGQRVSAGETLAELQHDEVIESLKIAELRAASISKIRSAESTLSLRKRRRDTIEPLFEAGHANQEEYEEAKLQFDVASADLQLAQEQKAEALVEVARIRAMIKAKTIRSPIDGVVTEIVHQPGEYISSADPQFATVVELERLKSRFYLLAEDVMGLTTNDAVRVRVRTGDTWSMVDGSVDFVSPVIDPDSGDHQGGCVD